MEPNNPVIRLKPINERRITRAARRRDNQTHALDEYRALGVARIEAKRENQIQALDDYVARQRERIQAEYDAAVNPPVTP